MTLLQKLKNSGLIQRGEFKLKSGQTSFIYFDFKSLLSYPTLISTISHELSKLISEPKVCVAGIPFGGLPYATLISQFKNCPMILIREDKKQYGMCQQIEGHLENRSVVLVEDVITTGSSVESIIHVAKEHGIKISQVICILDREAGGVSRLRSLGYNVSALFKMSELTTTQSIGWKIEQNNPIVIKLLDVIQSKRTNLILALDLTNSRAILSQLRLVGPHICAVKIHYDIIEDFSEEFINELNSIKHEFNLLVIEDRKLADIPYIALKQLVSVRKFADIVTVHGLCGPTLIRELNKTQLGILLVHQLSVADNLIDTHYSNKVSDLAQNFSNVIGFVSQGRVLENYLTFTPGINLNQTTDNQGQCYKSIGQTDSDIFIVGRSIYESADIVESVKLHQDLCYKTWNLS